MKIKYMKEILKIMLNGFLISTTATAIVVIILTVIESFHPGIIASSSSNVGKTDDLTIMELSIILPIAAMIEEIIFRLIPMVMVIYIAPRYLDTKSGILSVAIISSILFGYLHGNIVNVFIQGIAGFIFFMVWLAVYDIKKSIMISTLASSMTHLFDNIFFISLGYIAKILKQSILYN